MSITPPQKGFIFWPVGTGDSTTIRVDETVYLQIDLRHMEKSENHNDSAWPIIDELIKILPILSGKPHLSTFALTHPDQDHCQGFEEFNRRVVISELWMSPRTFREFRTNEDLCDDAEAFYKEARRRVKATIDAGGDPGQGNRIRIIGYDTLLQEDEFKNFPEEFFSVPGNVITKLDGEDHNMQFKAFVHAPFKDDSYADRNDCSLAFQITLNNGNGTGKALLMGDLTYPAVHRIFRNSEAETLEWNILLAPHHCSKSVMYQKEEGNDEEKLKEEIVQDMGNAALSPGYIVSSSEPIPQSNQSGDNPPHVKAKIQYQRIVPNEFICTHEHPNTGNPIPIIFEVTESGFVYLGEHTSNQPLSKTLESAGTGSVAPKIPTGFGSSA